MRADVPEENDMEPKTKAEAVLQIDDLERRARSFEMQMNWPRADGTRPNRDRAADYHTEAARLRALLPTLPN